MANSTETVGVRLSLKGQQQVKQGFRDTAQGVKGLRQEMRGAERDSEGMARGLRNAASVSIRAAAAVAVAGVGIVGTLGTIGVKTAAANEQAEVAFTNMMGSASAAKAYLADLKTFAAETPFELPDVQMGAQRLMAMGVATRDVLPYLTAIGDAVSGMGGGAEQINQVVTAIGQMQAKGKIQGDEVLQLTEAGIPALKILAAQYGVTTSAMSKMMEKGQVSADEALPKLIDGIEHGTKSTKAFGGMMEAQSKTLAGRWSTIKDVTTQGLAGAVEPLLPTLSRVMDVVAEELPGGMKAAERASENVATALNIMRPVFENVVTDVGLVRDAFVEGFRDSGYSMDDVRTGADNLEEAFDPEGPLVTGVSDLARGMGQVAGFISTVATKAEALNPFIDRISGWMSGSAEYDPVNLGVKQLTGGRVDLAASGWIKDTPKAKGSLFSGGWGSSLQGLDTSYGGGGSFGGNRQTGGNVSANRWYKSNERGTEYFQPATAGRIIPTRPDYRGQLAGDGEVNVQAVLYIGEEQAAQATVRGARRLAARRK